MSEAAWNKAFTHGSKAMQDRLRKVHAKNPKFQAWLQKSGHGAGVSVKQASKEVKPSARVKTLQQKSLKAYGATKGLRMGGEDGSGETVRDTVAPLTRDQHSKIQAAQRAAKAAAKPTKTAAPKKPLTKDQRIAAIAAAARKAKAKHDVPTMEPDDEGYDDLRDLHQSLHIRRGYNEEMEKVDEIVGVLAAMDKADKARSSNLKVGDNVRSIKMPIPGKVEKIENGKVYFRHESGKLYATHAGNLRKEEVELAEGKMKDIVTDREETARLAAQEKEPPFTPDKKPVRRGRGGPMSQAKWLAKQAMTKKMKEMGMKEEVEQVVEQDDTMEKKEMAQTQLHFMQYAAKEILEFIAMGGQIEEWYQNKLSKVHSDMEGLHSYIEGEKRRTGMVREESEEVEQEQIDEKYMGFKKLAASIKAKGGARDPEAVAAAIGRKKYGKEKFQAAAAAGKKMSEALDPVGKEDKDIDNDGDSDKTDVYLATKRKAIGNAIKDRLAKKLGK